jgi:hypothetical protein
MDFKHLFGKLEEIEARLSSIDKTLIKQEMNLERHMLRTDQNEELIQQNAERNEELFKQYNNELAPIKKHINMVEGVVKFIGIVSLLAGILQLFIK